MKTRLLLLMFLALLSFLFVLPSSVNAQFKNPNYYNTSPDVPSDLKTHTQATFLSVGTTISCFLTGYDPLAEDGRCLDIDQETKKLVYMDGNGGLIGITGSLIASTFYIPVSTHDYGSYVASNFGITKNTYAQTSPGKGETGTGIGFQALTPTLKLWTAFRNLTYLLFVILFVIVGLGIMFRIKIDPRTVMTIQNQIPKIIIALVLVTFSYAIAGFLIDLMYVSMYLIISIFAAQGYDTASVFSSNPFGAAGGIGGISGIAASVGKSLSGVISSFFDGTLGNIMGSVIGGMLGGFISPASGGLAGLLSKGGKILGYSPNIVGAGIGIGLSVIGGAIAGSKLLGLVAGFIAYLIIIIALFSALLRLWFVLIKSYIYLLISVVFAPFYIAFGLIPGRSGFGNWIRGIISNLVVFPTTIVMLLLGKAFIEGFSSGKAGQIPITPPLIGNVGDPTNFGAIIGLAIILMLPEVANMARDTLKSPEFKYSSAAGKFVGLGAGVVGAPVGQTWKNLTRVNNQGQPIGILADKLYNSRLRPIANFFLGTH